MHHRGDATGPPSIACVRDPYWLMLSITCPSFLPGVLVCDHLDIRKRLSKLTINSRPCTLLWKFSPKLHIVGRTKLRCSIWETPDMDELEDSRVEIIRPNTKYYVDKQIYFYKGKYYRLSDIGLGEQWYALILDDNEPTDLVGCGFCASPVY